MSKLSLTAVFLLLFVTLAIAESPVYSGTPSVLYNDGVYSFDSVFLTGDEFVQYSPRDELGRAGPAIAYLGPKRFNAGRDSIQSITPTGFKNAQYDFISGRNLYHRCHLIAHRMTSSGEYAENLFTGTAFLNLGAMTSVESKIAEYISRTGNHVLYKVTPDFHEDELVCRGVIIEAQSIEDMEIRICLYAFNVQPGVIIDYATGESCMAPFATNIDVIETRSAESDELEMTEVYLYILNTARKRFHKPDCKSVQDMKEANKKEYIGLREELIDMGYKPCGECKP